MGEWLRKIQEGDDRTKMRVAIGLTVLSMTIVILLWLFYFNTLVTFNGTAKTEETKTDEFSLWGSIKNGTALMIDNVKKGFGNVVGHFTKEKQYDVVPVPEN